MTVSHRDSGSGRLMSMDIMGSEIFPVAELMVRSAAIAEVQATLRALLFIGSQKGSRITVS